MLTQLYPNYISKTNKTTAFGRITIPNFHTVDKYLLRGAQPTPAQLKELKRENVKIVINLNNIDPTEEQITKNLGMQYVNLPFSPIDEPPESYINKFLEIMQKARKENKKVFLHCKCGKDRTGFFTTLYKVKFKLDTVDNAIQEMIQMGHNPVFNPKLIPLLKSLANSN